jgi:hypothetical protein
MCSEDERVSFSRVFRIRAELDFDDFWIGCAYSVMKYD